MRNDDHDEATQTPLERPPKNTKKTPQKITPVVWRHGTKEHGTAALCRTKSTVLNSGGGGGVAYRESNRIGSLALPGVPA